MRMSHLQALADIVLGDPEALARGFHEIVNGIGTDFQTEDARQRIATAVAAVGMSIDPDGFRAVCARLAKAASTPHPAFEPVCKRCGSTDLSRDASAVWDIDGQRWNLCGVYDSTTCQACTSESDDLCDWRPLVSVNRQPPTSDDAQAVSQPENETHE
ncbi:hypothetical protein DFR49_0745 [Hephaestia caeni]|uniref:Uncharacterized protein n=1 Tax=Hephaestia caeni TaxID=645617 RepID=A0A397PAU6_9SPHN|nr:hypothetical protein [Hephaestia caeni]RIA46212.1 hypothetical protein DFR49_0745 [Hephaestia caeni]